MSITPWYVGQLLPVWTFTLTDDSGAVVNLTGATMAMTIHNQSSGADTAGAGSWSLTNAAAGVATYTPASADVATAGNYQLYVTATIAGKPYNADPVTWQVNSY